MGVEMKPLNSKPGGYWSLIGSASAASWIRLTQALRSSCFPLVKESIVPAEVNSLALLVDSHCPRTESNVFRARLPFPLNLRVVYGSVVLMFLDLADNPVDLSLAQWKHLFAAWSGAASDTAMMRSHMLVLETDEQEQHGHDEFDRSRETVGTRIAVETSEDERDAQDVVSQIMEEDDDVDEEEEEDLQTAYLAVHTHTDLDENTDVDDAEDDEDLPNDDDDADIEGAEDVMEEEEEDLFP